MPLSTPNLHALAQAHALTLPGADIYAFTQDWEAARVAEKWFMLCTELQGEQVLILKAPPEDVTGLIATYDFITPGYHMNKKHWFTLRNHPSLTPDFLTELVTDSYLSVVEKLPRTRRPLGWQQYLGKTEEA